MAGITALSASERETLEQHLVVGGELLRADRVREARVEFEAALALQGDDRKALGLVGLACFRLGAFDDARGVYQRLVDEYPDDASYRLNLGLVHLKLGDASRAVAELSRTRELDPSMSRATAYLGLAHARAGQYREAYRAFLQVGQDDLAAEMEQHLSAEQLAAVPAGRDDPAGAEPAVAAPPDEFDATEGRGVGEAVVAGPADEAGAISQALEVAAPSAAAEGTAARSTVGHAPPVSISEFATARLIRPDDGDHPFEIGAGGVLVVRVRGRVMSRTEGVIVSGGELGYEPARRRMRGATVAEAFSGDRPLFIVSGEGHLVASPLGHTFAAVRLDDDALYLREELVFAFEDHLRWENGFVPGSDARISVVQFRGVGCVAVRTRRPALAVKLAPERVLYIDADALAGWIGRVVPRVVAPAAGGETSAVFVECSGEGVVLLVDSADAPDLVP